MVGKCKWCEKEIHWSKESGSWLPYEDEGRLIRHNCKMRVETVTAPKSADTTVSKVKVDPLSPEEVYKIRQFLEALKVAA